MLDNVITVFHNDKEVGKLAMSNGRDIVFQYSPSWIKDGFSISPFFLPLESRTFVFDESQEIDGLCGCFYDSLPDQWGYILLKKYLKTKGIDYDSLSVLERLCYSNNNSTGSLRYEPAHKTKLSIDSANLDKIYEKSIRILNDENLTEFDDLFSLGSSSGGSRPKINLNIDGHLYIIKYPNSTDGKNMGGMEFDYMNTAKECEIKIPDIRLFPSNNCSGYFGIERFDRKDNKKIHTITAASLVNKNAFTTVFTYRDIFKLTNILTNGNKDDLEQIFRIMVFNYLAHNEDDHAKNISFIYNEELHVYRLAPAYDLTHSHTRFGEHQIMVGNKGSNVTKEEFIEEASGFGLDNNKLLGIYNEIKQIVNTRLIKYL